MTSDCEYCRYVTESLVMIQEINDLLLDALGNYSEHFENCAVMYLDTPEDTINCSCGLDAIFKKVEKKFQ